MMMNIIKNKICSYFYTIIYFAKNVNIGIGIKNF